MKWRIFAKMVSFHTLLKKKSSKRCRFERHCSLSSSLDAQKTGEEESFVPLFSPSFLPPFSSKRRRPKTLFCSADPWPPTCWRNGGDVPPRAIVGRQHSGRPNHVSPLFSYKYRGDEAEQKRRNREKKTKRKKKGRAKRERNEEKRGGEKERKKTERGREKENKNEKEKLRKRKIKKTEEELPPTPLPSGTTTTAGHHWRPRLLQVNPPPLLLSFLPLPCRTCTVHVFAGEIKLVTVLKHSNQLMWAGLMDLGPSPVQPNNSGPGPAQQKIYIFLTFCDFPTFCFMLFCLNIGLYFMS